MVIRTINATFTEEEFRKLKKAKGNLSWERFILLLLENEKM
jgi:hypothetical protein